MSKVKIHIILVLISVLYTVALSAQTKIRGKVTDSKGQPVAGAAVILKGTANVGTISDTNGEYEILVPDSKTAEFIVSCLSYQETNVKVTGRSVVDIVIEDDSELLEEVVVVGYGAMRKSDLTGSLTSIKIDEGNAARSATLDRMLEGKAAGMQVITSSGEPDAGISVRIRGLSTFSGNSEPLYVVDGVIINGESESISTITQGYESAISDRTNGLAGINPQDIASIEVLKDASATAIYGSQGANGVVLITTRTADRDKPQVDFSAGLSVNQRMNKIAVCDFDQFVDYLVRLDNSESASMLSHIYENPSERIGLKVTPVDWQDYMTRTSISHRYYLSITGKPKTFKYMFSIGYNHNEGILRNSSADNLTMRLNLDKRIGKALTLGFKSGFGYTYSDLLSGATAGSTLTGAGSILRSMVVTRPFIDLTQEELEEDPDDDNARYGPNRWLTESKNNSKRFRITPSLYAQWRIIPSLTFKSTIGGDFRSNLRVKTKSGRLSTTTGNIAGIGKSNTLMYNWDNLLTFREKFGKHRLNVTLGQSLSRTSSSSENVQGWYLQNQFAEEMAINFAEGDYSSFTYSESASSLLSFFTRAIYNYDDRYVLTATYRLDGSSRFYGKNKWSGFPSFAFAWRLNDEPWFNVPVISAAKVRIGWGLVGNQAIGNYQTTTTFTTGSVGNHYSESQSSTSIYPGNIANPDLKWETSQQYNVGVDLSFWQGRLAVTVDAYSKETYDLLQNKTVAYSTGFKTIAMNDGSIRNQGLEFTVDAVPVSLGSFEWSIGGNISFNRNKIVSVGASGDSGEIYLAPGDKRKVNYFTGDPLQNSGNISPLNIFVEGQPMGLFYGFVVDGIVQENETGLGFSEGKTRGPGYIKYADLNENGYIDDGDKTIIGNPLPLFTYGFNTSFTYRFITLSADFYGVYGNDIFNLNSVQEYDIYSTTRNVSSVAVANAWTPENKSNRWPGIGKISSTDDGRFSTRTVEDGSYLKLSNVSLSFSVPINKRKSKLLKGLDLGLSCTNVFILSRYSGWSPTNNSYGSSVSRMGVDLSTAPIPRGYNFDIKFIFQ